MSAVDPALVHAMAERLVNWPADARPPNDDATLHLQISGIIEEKTQMKACPTCGTPRVDWTYMQITSAGKLFLAAYQTEPTP